MQVKGYSHVIRHTWSLPTAALKLKKIIVYIRSVCPVIKTRHDLISQSAIMNLDISDYGTTSYDEDEGP